MKHSDNETKPLFQQFGHSELIWLCSAHPLCEAKSEHGDGLEEIDVFGLVGGEKRKVYRDNTAIRLQSMEELLEAGTGEDEKEFLSVFVQFYKEHVEFFVPSNH